MCVETEMIEIEVRYPSSEMFILRNCGTWKVQNLPGWLAGWTSRKELQFKESEGSLQAEFLLAQRRSVFVFLRPSTDWMRPIHITEDNLLYLKCADLNINLIKI